MNQQRPFPQAPNEKRHLGVFAADLCLYRQTATYAVSADRYPRSRLIQLEVKMPIVGFTVLGYVDLKPETPLLVVMPKFPHVRGNPDAESQLLTEALKLFPARIEPARITVEAKEASWSGTFLSV